MMGDGYGEFLVSRDPSLKYRLLTILTGAAAAGFAVTGLTFWLPACIPAVICGVLAWFLSQRILVEYEYLILDHELSVDVIYGKTRRKKLLNCALRKVESFAPAAPERLDHIRRQGVTLEDYSTGRADQKHYCLETTSEKGKLAFLLTPPEEMLVQLSRELPRSVLTR